MSLNPELLKQIEKLRIPFEQISGTKDWKDWYHFVLINLETKIRILININLIDRPEQGEIQVTFIVNIPANFLQPEGYDNLKVTANNSIISLGTTFSQNWQMGMVERNPLQIQSQGVDLKFSGDRFFLAVTDVKSQLAINFQAHPQATPLLITEDSPFGSGFIGWGLVPGLTVNGQLSIGEQKFSLDENWCCYHDRNFGRFRWGEDIGWEWFVAFLTTKSGQKFTLVLDKRTNKNHSEQGLPYIFIYEGTEVRKIFLGGTLAIDWTWTNAAKLPLRLPGIMASLFTERTLKIPQSLQVIARDEQDQMLLNVEFDTMIELIVPDNQTRQYSFIAEVSGKARIDLFLQGEMLEAEGLIYAEYVI